MSGYPHGRWPHAQPEVDGLSVALPTELLD